MISRDDQTIIAQCTPTGSGALALLRVSGNDAIAIVDRVTNLSSQKSLSALPTHTIHYGSIVDNQTSIDNVLFLLMKAPKTFTGQDTIEITCHNNPFIIQKIIDLIINAGARLAQNGEFTKRAVMHNKIDLVQAEAINELIHANTQMALKKSLAQVDGSFSHWLQTIAKELVKALAFCEASFEFIDEEHLTFDSHIKTIICQTLDTLTHLKKTYSQQQHIRQGFRIAIVGSVNAGKSSLFNALIGKQRAIVTDVAGTTRDVIEAGLYKQGNYWTLIDTAGIRQTDDIIEQEGIKRSNQEAHKADILLLADDASRHLSTQEHHWYKHMFETYKQKIIHVHTKIDKAISDKENFGSIPVQVYCNDPTTVSTLENNIETKIQKLLAAADSPFLLNKRQYGLALQLEKELLDIKNLLEQQPIAYEIISIHINQALAHLTELTGKSISEAGMDAVFREFCVGK